MTLERAEIKVKNMILKASPVVVLGTVAALALAGATVVGLALSAVGIAWYAAPLAMAGYLLGRLK